MTEPTHFYFTSAVLTTDTGLMTFDSVAMGTVGAPTYVDLQKHFQQNYKESSGGREVRLKNIIILSYTPLSQQDAKHFAGGFKPYEK
jgi:hypothetical protein